MTCVRLKTSQFNVKTSPFNKFQIFGVHAIVFFGSFYCFWWWGRFEVLLFVLKSKVSDVSESWRMINNSCFILSRARIATVNINRRSLFFWGGSTDYIVLKVVETARNFHSRTLMKLNQVIRQKEHSVHYTKRYIMDNNNWHANSRSCITTVFKETLVILCLKYVTCYVDSFERGDIIAEQCTYFVRNTEKMLQSVM